MGKGLIAFLAAISASAWIYNKFMQRTGNLTQRSLTAAGVSGVVIFFAILIILSLFF